jgi:tRNA A-37 threonylcarbamoyl transferase component Bud32
MTPPLVSEAAAPGEVGRRPATIDELTEPVPLTERTTGEAELPQRIGRYRVLRLLGEGATSQVYLARDEFHHRDVAIKRVRWAGAQGSADDDNYQERFFAAEAALAGRLQHPNVVEILDAVPDPVAPYLVMEYVPGETLRRYCRPDQLLALETIVEIGFKCAMALGYVYRIGLVHRDIKPANLLVMHDRAGVVTDVKVSDFGSVFDRHAQTTQIFRVGSLAYMSPEQLEGNVIDCRADIYSLAAVLYHLIAGRPPFEAASQTALMHRVFHDVPPSLVNQRAGVSAALDAVIQRGLAKNPDDRFTTWENFAEALSGLVAANEVPRGQLQAVLDSERFNLLRSLEFFAGFGDVELWEVVHRAKWQRFPYGHKLFSRGEEGRTFYIIAQGDVEVFRDGARVAQLGAGTSVGEMMYLAPNPALRRHSADVLATAPTTTISFTPQTLAQLSPGCSHLFDKAFIRVLVRRLHAAHEALAHPRRVG